MTVDREFKNLNFRHIDSHLVCSVTAVFHNSVFLGCKETYSLTARRSDNCSGFDLNLRSQDADIGAHRHIVDRNNGLLVIYLTLHSIDRERVYVEKIQIWTRNRGFVIARNKAE